MSDLPYKEYDFGTTQEIDGVQLSARTTNALINNGVTSVAKILSLSDTELLGLSGLGRVGYNEIQEKLTSLSEEVIEKIVAASDDNTTGNYVSILSRYIWVDESITGMPIEDAYFSSRTYNALVNNGILTLGDLSKYKHNDLSTLFKGLGQVGLLEVESYLNHGRAEAVISVELHEFMLNHVKENHRMIFDRYYNLTNLSDGSTLQDVANEFGLTRERIRQINKAVMKKVSNAIRSKIINPNIELSILEHINSPLQEIPELSGVYRKYGVLKVYVDTEVMDVTIYKNPQLKSKWIVDKGYNINYQLHKSIDALRAQVGPVKIEELASEYSVDEKILYDIKNATINDGLIVLNTNKRATGNDLVWMIGNFMDKAVRPVTISEISQELNISIESTRGIIWRVPNAVNVGLSTYALEKYGYSNKTTAEIAKELLEEEQQPVHIDKIVSYVTKYRLVNDSSVSAAMSAASDVFTRLDDGYYALEKWGYESTARGSNRLDVPAKDAVLDVLSTIDVPMSSSDVLNAVVSRFGSRSTNKAVTVSSVLVNLNNKGIVIKLGTDYSPFYMLNKRDGQNSGSNSND